jgi:hypothetical protein
MNVQRRQVLVLMVSPHTALIIIKNRFGFLVVVVVVVVVAAAAVVVVTVAAAVAVAVVVAVVVVVVAVVAAAASWSTTALSCRAGLRAPVTRRATLARAQAPCRAIHERQVKGRGQTKCSP